MPTHVLRVRGMTCDHCVATLTKHLKATPGVREARVDLPSQTARVEHDAAVNVPALLAAVQKAGFQVAGFEQT